MTQQDHSSEHSDAVLYAEIFGLLVALTVLTVTLSYVNVGAAIGLPQFGRTANIVAGLLVAACKCSLVLWVFMHMNHENGTNRFVLFFAVCLMGVFFIGTSLDFEWLGTYTHGFARAALGL
ncbi:MAG TPA: cytochrome C oxidase subunit IV family protein [bacterium]|jgi:caa(3)-type oxidase subunit IV|nr:cytochrome C oxidase subunit IV family protein [bacterium]